MNNKIYFKKSVSKDIKKIDSAQRIKIMNQIQKVLSENSHKGKRLTGDFEGLWRLRIGDYRVIYTVIRDGWLILRIGHRKDIYE